MSPHFVVASSVFDFEKSSYQAFLSFLSDVFLERGRSKNRKQKDPTKTKHQATASLLKVIYIYIYVFLFCHTQSGKEDYMFLPFPCFSTYLEVQIQFLFASCC